MYKRLILLSAAIALVIIGTSLAQEVDELLMIEVASGTEEGGQVTTEVDTGDSISSELDFSGSDNSSLSGDFGSGTTSSGMNDVGQGTGNQEPTTGSFKSDPIPRLILSEVYYDGTDERIEITNIGDAPFSGNFTLEGVKSTLLSLTNQSFLPGQSKLFGDTLSQISGNRFIGKTGLSLNLIDTAPIAISLLISGQKVDEFLVDAYRVNLYNDKKTSFEKIGDIPTRTSSGRVANAFSGYTINPGVFTMTGNIPTNVSYPPTQSGDDLQLPVSCVSVDQRDLIKVSEIFRGNETYPPYIELSIHDDIGFDSLSISGSLLRTGIVFSWNTGGITLAKNTFFLISSSGFRQTSEGLIGGQNGDFSLVSTGNWLLITIGSGQTRQVMDIVYHSGEIAGESLYFSGSTRQCAHILDSVDDFSPGFERRFLKYISGRTGTKIQYITMTTGNRTTGSSCQSLSSSITISGDNSATTSGFIPQNYTIRIVNVDYDPEGSDTNNEKITLLAHQISGETAPLDLSKTFRLKVNGTNKTLPRTLPMDTPTTFTKTFGFPNSTNDGSDVTIQLIYDDYVFDTYTYNPNIQKEIVSDTGTQLTGQTIAYDLSGTTFDITYVLPNPEGKDDKEELGLSISGYTASTGIDLSQGFTLRRGTTKKKLSGIVIGGQENILSGNLGLVNKAACISLFYQEEELTEFCYRTPKEGEKIFASDKVLEATSTENIDILNALKIIRTGNNLCVRYQDESFLCKRIPASKAELKTTQEQKMYKGFSSLIKSYLMSDWKPLYYDTNIKRYYDLLSGSKKLIAQGYTQVDIYGQRIAVTDIKKQFDAMEHTPLVVVVIFEGKKALLKD